MLKRLRYRIIGGIANLRAMWWMYPARGLSRWVAVKTFVAAIPETWRIYGWRADNNRPII